MVVKHARSLSLSRQCGAYNLADRFFKGFAPELLEEGTVAWPQVAVAVYVYDIQLSFSIHAHIEAGIIAELQRSKGVGGKVFYFGHAGGGLFQRLREHPELPAQLAARLDAIRHDAIAVARAEDHFARSVHM